MKTNIQISVLIMSVYELSSINWLFTEVTSIIGTTPEIYFSCQGRLFNIMNEKKIRNFNI